MTFGKYTIISITAFLVIISGFTVFLLNGDSSTSDNSDQTHTSNHSNTTNITITNNVVNNINTDSETTVNSNISNDLNGDKTSEVTNSVENNVDGEGKANITNSIENMMNGHTVGSLDNLIQNNINGNGENLLNNSIDNALEANVNVNVSNDVENTTGNEEGSSGNDEGNSDNGDGTPSNEEGEIIWGIDSASETTEEFFACVRENFGDPVIFGRYLETKEDVSSGLTNEQIELIHSEGASILLIYNNFEDAAGYENGVAQAEQAISYANNLGVPEGVALFADIEPGYPVDSDFIRGWFDTLSNSEYESGIYGIFDPERDLFSAYNQAIEEDQAILDNNYIWTASPNIGITTEQDAPDFNPEAPEGSLAWGWQYGIDSAQCNIDTNLFNSNLMEVLWLPES